MFGRGANTGLGFEPRLSYTMVLVPADERKMSCGFEHAFAPELVQLVYTQCEVLTGRGGENSTTGLGGGANRKGLGGDCRKVGGAAANLSGGHGRRLKYWWSFVQNGPRSSACAM